MERILTALMTGLWIGVAAGLGVAYWIWSNPDLLGKSSGYDGAMGESLLMLAGGIAGGLLAAAIACGVTYRFATPEQLRSTQMLSAVAIAVLLVVGTVWMRREAPRKFMSYTGVLDIEVRVPKALYESARLKGTLVVGMSSFLPPGLGRDGKVREEDGYVVQSSSMVVPGNKDHWVVTVAANGIDQMWVQLPWLSYPDGAMPWTEWMAPAQKEGGRSNGIEVRCRWRLSASSVELYVRRFLS